MNWSVLLMMTLSLTTVSGQGHKLCGGVATGNGGEIQHPDGQDQTYGNNEYCDWSISVEEGYGIEIKFESFNLEEPDHNNRCLYDNLKITEISSEGKIIQRRILCGTQTPSNYVTSTSKVDIEFQSDDSGTAGGFRIIWSKVVQPSCHYKLIDSKGKIIPKIPPGISDKTLVCEWDLIAPKGEFVIITFTSFMLNTTIDDSCGNDYIQVFDVMGNSSLAQRGRWCGTDQPPMLKSFGRRMVVKFHTEDTTSYVATPFLAEWIAVESCGGEIDTDQDYVMSYNYPGMASLISNKKCVWNINVQQGYHVELTFHFPSGHQSCDNLQVKDYYADGEPLEGKPDFCQGDHRILSSGNKMDIIYTPTAHNHNGFLASWKSVCGNVHFNSEGNISSPNYPFGYENSLDCGWKIVAKDNQHLHLTFSPVFEIEASETGCDYDYVEVLDKTEGKYFTRRFCGHEQPGELISYFPVIFISFHSDKDKNGKGFELSWTSDKICGGEFRDNTGNLSSPNVPTNYQAPLNCTWIIHLDPGLYSVTFRVDKLDIGQDYLKISWKDVHGIDLYTDITGVGRWTQNEIDNSEQLMVHFVTTAGINGTGFSLTWERACDFDLHDTTGNISSPKYPYNYPDNQDCTWNITVDPNQQIILQFDVFDLETEPDNCGYDYVQVLYPFSNGTWRSGCRWCGNNRPPLIYSFNSQLIIKFHSDINKTRKGFRASWRPVQRCGGTYNANSGFLMSYNYPSNYPNDLYCKWEIIPSNGVNITLSFDSLFDIEEDDDCLFDFLEVTTGNGRTNKYCGTHKPDLIVSGGNITIVFKSDDSNDDPERGFFLSWSPVV